MKDSEAAFLSATSSLFYSGDQSLIPLYFFTFVLSTNSNIM